MHACMPIIHIFNSQLFYEKLSAKLTGKRTLKKSIQWDIVGVFALVMAFVSFFALMFSSTSVIRNNMLLLGLSNPLLTVVFVLFAFMSFIFGYFESKKAEEIQFDKSRSSISMQLVENPKENPLGLLNLRLAKGEITLEEYERTKETLES